MRHHLLDKGFGFVVGGVIVYQYLIDVVAQVVANRANNDIAFLQDEQGGFVFFSGFGHRAPEVEKVVQVPLQFFGAATDPGGAHNNAHAVRDGDIAQGFA